MKHILSLVLILISLQANSQKIFAHNDYVNSDPFHSAYNLKVDFIESDVFLVGDKLYVAHTKREIDTTMTLQKLYLDPLLEKIQQNNHTVYSEKDQSLTLMIDIKTEAEPTLEAIVKTLDKYPALTNCKQLFVAISGNYPTPVKWKNYPAFILFDGRPGIAYTDDQRNKLRLISANFNSVSKWNGEGEIPASDVKRIKKVIAASKKYNDLFRFWAIPDNSNAWPKLYSVGVNVINTDHPSGAVPVLR